jgi:hypothetical protein
MNLYPFLYIWIILDAVVLVLFGWRQSLARKEDSSLHVLHAGVPQQQVALVQKLGQIDKWGKITTVVAVVYGLILGVLAIVQAISSPGMPGV